eukprot:TRINITY_DN33646_c1_g1_i1.p1 TRINITY_DN33646_c1_g1~~TRINITY_DN33646_c1_g1_i1.p1  ORF type:complete len:226 (-),score=39.36 TRINITY_DN33646_c1_g1_i1:89-709(-)
MQNIEQVPLGQTSQIPQKLIEDKEQNTDDVNQEMSLQNNGNVENTQNVDEGSEGFSDDSDDYDSEVELETQEGEAHQAVVPPMLDVNRRKLMLENMPSQELDLIGDVICYGASSKSHKQKYLKQQFLSNAEMGVKLGLGFMGPIVGRDWDLQDKWLFCQGLSEMGKRDFNTLQKNYLQHKESNQLVSYYYNVWKIEKYNFEILNIF